MVASFFHRTLGAALLSNGKNKVSHFHHAVRDFDIPYDNIKIHFEVCFEIIQMIFAIFVATSQFDNLLFSLKVSGMVFFLSQVGKIFSNFGLLWFGTILAFTFPLVYEDRKREIDSFVHSTKKALVVRGSPIWTTLLPFLTRQ
eukprot:TRINITY_DN1655_c0_g1_i18.p1 TRINITY_DN1655_c0_g1~~TRINITY_DN1655_c0_g1_i18.p1  ORF type:complete len:143 (+),score=27.01 TRINITY_DN1655_c0_g1_i18:802-1230(+)